MDQYIESLDAASSTASLGGGENPQIRSLINLSREQQQEAIDNMLGEEWLDSRVCRRPQG